MPFQSMQKKNPIINAKVKTANFFCQYFKKLNFCFNFNVILLLQNLPYLHPSLEHECNGIVSKIKGFALQKLKCYSLMDILCIILRTTILFLTQNASI